VAEPALQRPILGWYARHARDLPWRRPDATAWGVFVSEVMLQQTPVSRVEPVWRAWLARWPTPADLAGEAPGEAVRAWGRLGYPRRALRLHEAATAMLARHDGAVPDTVDALLALPGVGTYTAAAVASFGFGRRASVVDTNVRRVQARAVQGVAQAARGLTRAETDIAARLLPLDPGTARTWNVAVMELGALVCTSRAPRCGGCPVADLCVWRAAGYPAYQGPVRPSQAWHGTDRQLRGAILALLRSADGPVHQDAIEHAAEPLGADPRKLSRCVDSLVADGLLERLGGDGYQLPGLATSSPTA
jgi:A/G-specific adenine glycosylase